MAASRALGQLERSSIVAAVTTVFHVIANATGAFARSRVHSNRWFARSRSSWNVLGYPARTRGEVAEWLKAAPC
jgi:hypothetical protein